MMLVHTQPRVQTTAILRETRLQSRSHATIVLLDLNEQLAYRDVKLAQLKNLLNIWSPKLTSVDSAVQIQKRLLSDSQATLNDRLFTLQLAFCKPLSDLFSSCREFLGIIENDKALHAAKSQ